MTLSPEAVAALRQWLEENEYSIADGFENLDVLTIVFKEVVGRDPSTKTL